MKLSPNSLSLDSLAALPERERRLVLGGLALAAAILIFGVLIPLDRSVAHAHDRLARKRADLTWMQGVAPELAASAPAPAATGESLLVIIDRSARESGLGGALAGSEPGGPGSLSVRLPQGAARTAGGGGGRAPPPARRRRAGGSAGSPSRTASAWSQPPLKRPIHPAW